MGKKKFPNQSFRSIYLNIFFNRTSNNSSSTTNQPLKFNTTPSSSSSSSSSSSNKITIDPAFIRQALFHPSNNTSNPVQFQVKL